MHNRAYEVAWTVAATEQGRGSASALFESMTHIGGASTTYLTRCRLTYRSTELVGVAVVAVITFVVLPREDGDPTTESTG